MTAEPRHDAGAPADPGGGSRRPGDDVGAVPPPVRLLLEHDMDAPACQPFAGGTACVFSARSPSKETPNEDAALLLELPGGRGVLAVADGVGGMPAGGSASRLALETLARVVRERSDGSARAAILDAFEQGNEAVRALGNGTATTLVVAELTAEGDARGVRSYHVGDSALLLAGQRGRLKHETIPHSPVGYAVEAGLLDAKAAMVHEDRHLVSNIVGSAEMHIAVGPGLPVAARDTLVLGSDGLFDNLTLDEIVERVRKGPLEDAVAGLVSACRGRMNRPTVGRPSKPDDLTVVVWRPR